MMRKLFDCYTVYRFHKKKHRSADITQYFFKASFKISYILFILLKDYETSFILDYETST